MERIGSRHGEPTVAAVVDSGKKLAAWLGQHGYLDAATVADATERGDAAARDLPRAQKLSRLLCDHAEATRRGRQRLPLIVDGRRLVGSGRGRPPGGGRTATRGGWEPETVSL